MSLRVLWDQELRKLVRRVHSAQQQVHSAQEQEAADEAQRKAEATKIRAQKALTTFLRSIARQISNEY